MMKETWIKGSTQVWNDEMSTSTQEDLLLEEVFAKQKVCHKAWPKSKSVGETYIRCCQNKN